MLHEVIFPTYLHIPEEATVLAYGLGMLAYLIAYREYILKTEFLLVFLALGFFGLSLVFDLIPYIIGKDIRGSMLLEDGAKFCGIVTWFAYCARTSFQYLRLAGQIKQ